MWFGGWNTIIHHSTFLGLMTIKKTKAKQTKTIAKCKVKVQHYLLSSRHSIQTTVVFLDFIFLLLQETSAYNPNIILSYSFSFWGSVESTLNLFILEITHTKVESILHRPLCSPILRWNWKCEVAGGPCPTTVSWIPDTEERMLQFSERTRSKRLLRIGWLSSYIQYLALTNYFSFFFFWWGSSA